MSAIYLSRAGQTYGPVSHQELQSLRASGEIYEYAWIFESPDRGWEAIHPMPPAPSAGTSRAQELAQKPLRTPAPAATPQSARRSGAPLRPARPVEVVMHDFHHLVTGSLGTLSEVGCELICDEQEEAGPVFSERSRLVLNLLDPATGRAMNVAASLTEVARKNGHWSYQLKWDQVPEILL